MHWRKDLYASDSRVQPASKQLEAVSQSFLYLTMPHHLPWNEQLAVATENS